MLLLQDRMTTMEAPDEDDEANHKFLTWVLPVTCHLCMSVLLAGVPPVASMNAESCRAPPLLQLHITLRPA